jgi:CheY-like chemotaxis protein
MLQPHILDVNVLITQLEKMLHRLIGEDIELVTALAPELAPIRADPSSIEQILVNLAANAREAMPLGGRLTIETGTVELDEVYASAHVSVIPGTYVLIAVSDTGRGMDPATAARVFEPFFTTKEQGRGSGLGLSSVYGVVKQSGGYIWVYSELEHGTTFKVYLPVAHTGQPQTASADDHSESIRGTETVLLVEDEEAVRMLAREVLRRHGYQVLEARHGLDALRVAERHGSAIHLLITDVVMPFMSGRDLANRLSEVRSDLKVLFMSGYTDHAVMHRDVTPGAAFIQKPFTPDALARKVRSVLDLPRA